MTTEQTNRINEIKSEILVGFAQTYKNSSNVLYSIGANHVMKCQLDCEGFGKQVADSVLKYKSCSGKQAWVIAKTLVENNF